MVEIQTKKKKTILKHVPNLSFSLSMSVASKAGNLAFFAPLESQSRVDHVLTAELAA
jgi:hypothetical protein